MSGSAPLWEWDDEPEATVPDEASRTASSRNQKRRWRCASCRFLWVPSEGAVCWRCAGSWPRYRVLRPGRCLDCGGPAPRDGMHRCAACREA
jgi:hypothetical protein